MITWLIMFIQKIVGANYVAIIVAAVWALYLGLFLVITTNRGTRQLKTAVIVGLCATAICDVVWFFKFFDNFTYLDPGISGMLWFCLLPAAMLFIVMFLSYVNTSRFEHENKKRLKAEEKQRKKDSRRAKYENENPPEQKGENDEKLPETPKS